MNGIERITARIKADARAEMERILAEARAEAAQITARYQAAAKAEAAALAEKNEKAAAGRRERLLSAARMEGRNTQLAVRQSLVEQAYGRALEQLCAMPEKQYVKWLAALLKEAAVSGGGEVIFSAEDRDAAGRKAVEQVNAEDGKQLNVAEETRVVRGGFILKDRRMEVNCTFEALVQLQRTETAGAVARTLFGE